MRARAHDPLRLDVAAFAADRAELGGHWPLAGFERVVSATHEEARPRDADAVRWSLRGELRARRGDAPQVWLHLRADAQVRLVCQRCLAPVEVPLAVERSFLFVDGEERAAELDAEFDDDVLALTRRLDVHALLEDELLLGLPLVPRHAQCVAPVAAVGDAADSPDGPGNPFAVLRGLRRGGDEG